MKASRILIVEDEEVLAKDLARMLRFQGHQVVGETAYGEEAVDKAVQTAPDLILMDIKLRGSLDGIGAASLIREKQDVAIVYVTAHTEKDVFDRARQTEPEAYLSKPVSASELARTVEIALYKHRTRKLLVAQKNLSQSLSAETDLVAAMRYCVDWVLDMSGLDAAGMYVVNSDNSLDLVVHKGLSDEFVREVCRLGPDSPQACLILEGKADYRTHREIADNFNSLRERERLLAVAVVPVLHDGRVVACLNVASRASQELPIETCHMVETLAAQVGSTIARIRAEQELRVSSERLNLLVSQGPAVLFSARAGGDFGSTFVSDNVRSHMGYAPADFMSDSSFWLDRIHPEDRPGVLEGLKGLMDKGQFTGEYRFRHRDGSWRWMRDQSVLIEDEDGNPKELIGTWTDISAVKDREEALRRSEARYKQVFHNSAVIMAVVDGDGNFVSLNPTFTEVFGYGEEDVENLTIEAISGPSPLLDGGSLDVQAQGEPEAFWTMETPLVTREGKTLWTQIYVSPLSSEGDYEKLSLIVISDISERRRAEEAMRESEKRYRRLVENAGEAIFVAQQGTIVFANPRCVELSGHSEDELLSRQVTDLVHPDDREQVLQYQMDLLLGDNHRRGDYLRMLEKNGNILWVAYSLTPITWNQRPAALCFATDVTERKRHEETQKELMEEMRRFSYIVSHDLRAPLVNIKGFANELKKAVEMVEPVVTRAIPGLSQEDRTATARALHTDIPEAFEFIDASLVRMNHLISGILKLSRLGRRELSLERLDMNRIVDGTLKSLAHEIDTLGIRIAVEPLPEVVADSLAVEQIMGNLLGNAIKYSDPDRVQEIRITGYRSHDETSFTVKDSGRGIDSRFLTKIFEIFERAGRNDVPGEGMGLAYVRTLVRRHRGRIWCESEPGKGAAFTFTIGHGLSQPQDGEAPSPSGGNNVGSSH